MIQMIAKDDFLINFTNIVKRLHLIYNNIELYRLAFTHKTYGNEHKCPYNERLEFLGDAILDFLVGEYLYKKFPEMLEGELSKTRAKFVCAEANAEYSKILKLNEALLLGKGEAAQGGDAKPSVLADLFEAFLGAVYLDLGIGKVRDILNHVIFSRFETIDQGFFADYKSELQEYIQAESRESLVYNYQEEGPSHDKTYVVEVIHEGVVLGSGTGKSKSKAEQSAAKDALSKMAR